MAGTPESGWQAGGALRGWGAVTQRACFGQHPFAPTDGSLGFQNASLSPEARTDFLVWFGFRGDSICPGRENALGEGAASRKEYLRTCFSLVASLGTGVIASQTCRRLGGACRGSRSAGLSAEILLEQPAGFLVSWGNLLPP